MRGRVLVKGFGVFEVCRGQWNGREGLLWVKRETSVTEFSYFSI